MKRSQKIALAFVAALSLGVTASPHARGMGPDGGCAMQGGRMGNPARMDSHLEQLKKELNITAEQEPAWSAFTGTMKQQRAEMMSAMQARMQGRMQQPDAAPSTQSAPDRIGERIQTMKKRLAGMEAMEAAMKQLYGSLTPQQKEILDGRVGKRMPMM